MRYPSISRDGALELVLPVQRHDGGGGGVPAPFGLRQQHHQLELIAVRVGSVERLGGTMVAFPGESTRLDQLLAGNCKLPNPRELPSKVVEPGAASQGTGCCFADFTQAKVMVIVRSPRPEKSHGAFLRDDVKAEHLRVKLHGALEVHDK